MNIKIERIYDNPNGNTGFKILVDRLWPRGLKKDGAKIDLWQKDIAPSNSLRKWFGHEEKKWNEFKHRYFKELDKNKDSIDIILCRVREDEVRSVTLLYAAKDQKFNNAVALKEYLEWKLRG